MLSPTSPAIAAGARLCPAALGDVDEPGPPASHRGDCDSAAWIIRAATAVGQVTHADMTGTPWPGAARLLRNHAASVAFLHAFVSHLERELQDRAVTVAAPTSATGEDGRRRWTGFAEMVAGYVPLAGSPGRTMPVS